MAIFGTPVAIQEVLTLPDMNTNLRPSSVPVDHRVEPELTFFDDVWDSGLVADLIRSKSSREETPAFLFVGKKEAGLLRDYLAEVFGAEAVVTLHDTYYMGLEVIELECESFFFTSGRKSVRTLQDPISRRPVWRDLEDDAHWHFRA